MTELHRGPQQAYDPMTGDYSRLDVHQVHEARRQLGLRVSGFDVPRPVHSFEQCQLDSVLTAAIKRAGFTKPTAIQAQALPAALSGRDVLVRRSGRIVLCIALLSMSNDRLNLSCRR